MYIIVSESGEKSGNYIRCLAPFLLASSKLDSTFWSKLTMNHRIIIANNAYAWNSSL